MGTISSAEAESKLIGKEPGTYLSRWSPRSQSMVVSFVDLNNRSQIMHVGQVMPNPHGGVIVTTSEGIDNYDTFAEFIDHLKITKTIATPLISDYWSLKAMKQRMKKR